MTADQRPPTRPQPVHADVEDRPAGRWDMAELERRVDPDLRLLRDRETANELRRGLRVGVVLGFAWMLVVVALLSIAWLLFATSRSAPDPTTPPPGASGATGSVGTSARVEASTSGPGLSGPPHPSPADASVSQVAGSTGRPMGRGAPLLAARIRGTATWLCDPPRWPRCTKGYPEGSFVAARGSEIPVSWRGKVVRVWHGRRHVDVRIVDACWCPGQRVIDLYAIAFRELAPQGDGEIPVTVELLGAGPQGTLPPTDTDR